jgi:hypothetical protein
MTWRKARVELMPGYSVLVQDGKTTTLVADGRVAFEGAFLHIDVPGTEIVQVVSASAVRLVTYQSTSAI